MGPLVHASVPGYPTLHVFGMFGEDGREGFCIELWLATFYLACILCFFFLFEVKTLCFLVINLLYGHLLLVFIFHARRPVAF